MVVFLGTGIDDVFSSGPDADRLEGRGGNDSLAAGSGNDALFGGAGNDTLKGGNNDDTLTGGAGLDRLFGGNGFDQLEGGNDADTLFGGADNDFLYGGDGGDTLNGDAGNDQIEGGDGSDFLYGGDGDDDLYGDNGSDTIYGGDGGDDLYGGDGTDYVYAGAGNDELSGDGGLDSIFGGAGNDELYIEDAAHIAAGELYDGGKGNDDVLEMQDEIGNAPVVFDLTGVTLKRIEELNAENETDVTVRLNGDQAEAIVSYDRFGIDAGSGTATLEIALQAPGSVDLFGAPLDMDGDTTQVVIEGSNGKDNIKGSEDYDTQISGKKGNDILFSLGTGASISGGKGRDNIEGNGGGNHTLFGDKGDDFLLVFSDDNTAYGGDGADTFDLSGRDNTVFGGSGSDEFRVRNDLPASVDGGAGNNDLITFTEVFDPEAGFTVNLTDNVMRARIDDTIIDGSITGIEHVTGSDLGDDFTGDDMNNTLTGLKGDDFILGRGGNDRLIGGNNSDVLVGGADLDQLFGGKGDDVLDVGDAPTDLVVGEVYNGGQGDDTLAVGAFASYTADLRDVTLRSIEMLTFSDPGEDNTATVILNADQIGGNGLASDATIDMFELDDVIATLDVRMGDSTNLDLSGMTIFNRLRGDDILIKGDASAEDITGTQERDIITGGKGADTIDGAGGNDNIFGDKGADILFGGAGSDLFSYEAASESKKGNNTRDTIADFFSEEEGDDIVLLFDANTVASGFQEIDFIGNTAFSNTAGELRTKLANDDRDVRVLLDRDGDGAADFEILLLDVDIGDITGDSFFFLP